MACISCCTCSPAPLYKIGDDARSSIDKVLDLLEQEECNCVMVLALVMQVGPPFSIMLTFDVLLTRPQLACPEIHHGPFPALPVLRCVPCISGSCPLALCSHQLLVECNNSG